MAEIEQSVAAEISDTLDAGDATAPASAGTAPFGGGTGTADGGTHYAPGTTPMHDCKGLNAGTGTRPMGDNWNMEDNSDLIAKVQQQVRLDRARDDASFRAYCLNPGDRPGPIAGLEFIQPKGQNDE